MTVKRLEADYETHIRVCDTTVTITGYNLDHVTSCALFIKDQDDDLDKFLKEDKQRKEEIRIEKEDKLRERIRIQRERKRQ